MVVHETISLDVCFGITVLGFRSVLVNCAKRVEDQVWPLCFVNGISVAF